MQGFLEAAETTFRGHAVWRGAGEAELEAAGDFLEKYLLTKLHPRIFAAYPADRERDEVLAQRMAALGHFVEPRHLDIPERARDPAAWAVAEEELRKVNMYKAPRDKIVCVLNCCRIINNVLATAAQAGEAAGADDFLPVLIYVTIRAGPERLESNLQYIQRFRRAPRLSGEGAYFYTNLVSAASFVETITADSLSMDPEAFRVRMWEAGVPGAEPAGHVAPGADADGGVGGGNLMDFSAASQLPVPPGAGPTASTPVALPASPAARSGAARAVSPPEAATQSRGASLAGGAAVRRLPELVELEGEGMAVVAGGGGLPGGLAARHPFFHAAVGDLTVADVAALLEAYKEAVLRYEALAGGYAALLRGGGLGGAAAAVQPAAPPTRRLGPAAPAPAGSGNGRGPAAAGSAARAGAGAEVSGAAGAAGGGPGKAAPGGEGGKAAAAAAVEGGGRAARRQGSRHYPPLRQSCRLPAARRPRSCRLGARSFSGGAGARGVVRARRGVFETRRSNILQEKMVMK